MNYTSIEQSKHLLELGLKAETADACYDVGYGNIKAHIECENFISYFTNDEYPELKDRYIPCWSVGALLELMPKTINWKFLDIFSNGEDFCIEYNNPNGESLTFHQSESLVEVCYETMCWLLQNNYIKTE